MQKLPKKFLTVTFDFGYSKFFGGVYIKYLDSDIKIWISIFWRGIIYIK